MFLSPDFQIDIFRLWMKCCWDSISKPQEHPLWMLPESVLRSATKSKTTRVNTLSLFKRASHLPPLAKHHWNVAENICEAIQVFAKNKFLSWSVTEQLHHAQLDWKHGMNTIKLDCHEKRRWKVPKSKHCILDPLQQWYLGRGWRNRCFLNIGISKIGSIPLLSFRDTWS